eukprot:4237040-Amphidinium_carterae.1
MLPEWYACAVPSGGRRTRSMHRHPWYLSVAACQACCCCCRSTLVDPLVEVEGLPVLQVVAMTVVISDVVAAVALASAGHEAGCCVVKPAASHTSLNV